MRLFGRETREGHADWAPGTAFVLFAEAPAEHAPSFGKGSQRSIGLLIDSPTGVRQLSVHAKHDVDKWLVPGQNVAVRVDPADAGNVEIAWDQLLSMEARVAAGDWTLVDPIAAEAKVAQARRLPPSDRAERLQAALSRATAAPAPPGRHRAVVIVATIRGRSWLDAGSHATSYRDASAAVLCVNRPGQAPYAVLEARFKCPKGQETAVSQELPALVSADDPNEIEVLWAEVQSDASYGAAVVDDRLADGAGGAFVAPRSIAGLDPDAIARQRLATIKGILAKVQDPASRQAMIDQYRAMGIEVDADDLT